MDEGRGFYATLIILSFVILFIITYNDFINYCLYLIKFNIAGPSNIVALTTISL